MLKKGTINLSYFQIKSMNLLRTIRLSDTFNQERP